MNKLVTLLWKYVWSVDALDQSYWQTMRKGPDNRHLAGGFWRSEDRLVKRDGKWLIKSRKLVVFTD